MLSAYIDAIKKLLIAVGAAVGLSACEDYYYYHPEYTPYYHSTYYGPDYGPYYYEPYYVPHYDRYYPPAPYYDPGYGPYPPPPVPHGHP